MNGDTVKALRAIKAKTLIMTGTKDLLNPEWEPQDAARFIRDVRVTTISPGTVTGHASAGGAFPADVDFLNREISQFLDLVPNGKKLNSSRRPANQQDRGHRMSAAREAAFTYFPENYRWSHGL